MIEGYTRGGCLLLIPLVYGITAGGTYPFMIFYTCFLLVTVDLLWALNCRQVSIKVETDSSGAQAGTKVGLLLKVNNPSRWPLPWVQLLVGLPETFALEDDTGCYNFSLKPLERKVVADHFICNFRGKYKWGGLLIRTGGILGIFSVVKFMENELELEVLPRFTYLGQNALPIPKPGDPMGLQERKIRTLRRGNDSAGFLGIRAYNSTDDCSKIHWKASARMNGLYVKEFRESKNSEFIIYLDNGENFVNADADRKDFEVDVTIAASVMATLIKNGHAAGVVSGGCIGPDAVVSIGRGPKHFRAQLKQLAGVAPVKGAGLRDGLVKAAASWPPGTGIVLITRCLDDASAKLLGVLKSRGYDCIVLLVNCIDDRQLSGGRKTGSGPAAGAGIPVITFNQDHFRCINKGA